MPDANTMRRNFLWNTFGNIIYMGCQFLCGILVVRLAGEVNSGNYNVALAVTNIFVSVASYGMYSYQVSDFENKYSQSTYIASRLSTCILATVLCMGYTLLGATLGENPYSKLQCACILIYQMYRMVESITDVYNAIDQKSDRLDIVGKTYTVRGIASLIVFIAVLWITHNMVLTLLFMVAVNVFLFFFYTLPKARPFYVRTPVTESAVLALLWECLPLAIYNVLANTTASIPKLMLEKLMGEAALGIYSPVTQPVLLLQVGATYLFTPFITLFAQNYAQRNRKGFYKAILAVQGIVLLLLPAGLLVCRFLGRWGLAVFVGAGLEKYDYLLPPMVLSAVLTAMMLFYSMVLTVMRCMRGLIFANVCGILAAAAISSFCIETWGLQGTTFATIGALCVQCVFLIAIVFVNARRHFDSEDT
ncbi:lipopolysaccharide biosynthesis protein [uncultured Ruthenibacterium sp.]|uniref:lipopolysaccharide biosynthesis protein n=1 Tax=uncultured Ruthenibacterium sp. TaxID=1905347 RepID=UPI00349E77EC